MIFAASHRLYPVLPVVSPIQSETRTAVDASYPDTGTG